MFISCCINNCLSRNGNCKDETTVTFFSFRRQDNKYYQAWVNAVEPYLRKGHPCRKHLYICERHFSENMLLKDGTKILKDGKEIIVPRRKTGLTKDAVPTIFNVNIKAEVAQPLNNKSNIVNLIEKRKQASPQPVKNECNKPVLNATITHCSCPEKSDNETVYTKDNLMRDWYNKPSDEILQKWIMVDLINDGLYFGFCEGTSNEPKLEKHVCVHNDMSTKFLVGNRLSNFPIVKQIKCFGELCSTLLKISCLRICENSLCKDICFEPKPHSSNVICKTCQIQKRRKDKRENQRLQRLIARNERNKKQKKDLIEIQRRYEKKSLLFQQTTNKLMDKCTTANEKKSEEVYPKPNKRQQEKRQRKLSTKEKIGDDSANKVVVIRIVKNPKKFPKNSKMRKIMDS